MANVVRTQSVTTFDTYEDGVLKHHEVEGIKDIHWIVDNYGRCYNPVHKKKIWTMGLEEFKYEAMPSSTIIKKFTGYELPEWIKGV